MTSTKVNFRHEAYSGDLESWLVVSYSDKSKSPPALPDINEDENLDLHALSSAWDSSYGASPLTSCYLASKVKNRHPYSREQVNDQFHQLISCKYVEELEEPLKLLDNIFNGLLEVKLVKTNKDNGGTYQVLISFNTERHGDMHCLFRSKKTLKEKSSTDFDKLLESGIIDDKTEPTGLNLPAVIPEQQTKAVGFNVNGFLYGSASTTKASTQLSPALRKLENFELKLFVTLMLSDLVKDNAEYFELFPTNPFNSSAYKPAFAHQENKQAVVKEKKMEEIQQELEERTKQAGEFLLQRKAKRGENENLLPKLVGQLQLFRVIQNKQTCIENRHFQIARKSSFFNCVSGIYDTDISKGITDYVLEQDRMKIVKREINYSIESIANSVVSAISKTENLIPSQDLPSRITDCPNVKPAGIALYNWGSTCFMDSAFVLVAANLHDTETYKELNEFNKISAQAMTIMLDKAFELNPGLLDGDFIFISFSDEEFKIPINNMVHSEKMYAIATKLATLPLSSLNEHECIVGKPPETTSIKLQLPLWNNFRKNYCNLVNKLNSSNEHDFQQIPIPLQISFLNSYYELSRYLYSLRSLSILLPRSELNEKLFDLPTNLMFAGIDQQDPQEFIQDTFDLLGIYDQAERLLQTSEFYEVKKHKSEEALSTHQAKIRSASQFISLHNKTESALLDDIIDNFFGLEELNYEETIALDPFKRLVAKNNGIKTEQLKDKEDKALDKCLQNKLRAGLDSAFKRTFKTNRVHKQLKPISDSSKIPDRLMLQLKLFERKQDGTTTKPKSKYKAGTGTVTGDLGRLCLLELIKNKGIIKVPIYLDDKTEKTLVPYYVDCVVCHSGDSAFCGHYRTLRFKHEEVIFYDDDTVVTFNDYQTIHGYTECSLLDFIDLHKLSGYLYALRRVES